MVLRWRLFDRFSRFCTPHGSESQYFTMGRLFSPQNCPSRGESGPHHSHHLTPIPWTHASPHHKQHLDRFIRFWATVCKTVRPMLSDRCLSVCLSVCPVCDVGVLWPKGWMDQDETWHEGRPRLRPHSIRFGPSSPSPKGATARPNFRPMSVGAKRLDGLRCHLVRR